MPNFALLFFILSMTQFAIAAESTELDRVLNHSIVAQVVKNKGGPALIIRYSNPHLPRLEEWRKMRLLGGGREPHAPIDSRDHWKQKNKYDHFLSLEIRSLAEGDLSKLRKIDPEVLQSLKVKEAVQKFSKLLPSKDIDRREVEQLLKKKPIQISNYESPFDIKGSASFEVSNHGLFSVHQSSGFDQCRVTGGEIDDLVGRFKEQGRKVVFLVTDDHRAKDSWVGQRRDADHVLFSFVGEHDIPVRAGEITLTGGYAGNCLSRAGQETIRQHFKVSNESLNLHFPMGAIYIATDHHKFSVPRRTKTVNGERIVCPETLDEARRTFGIQYAIERLVGKKGEHILASASDPLGAMTASDYSIEFFFDGERVEGVAPIGNGSKKIRVNLWSPGKHPMQKQSSSDGQHNQPVEVAR